MIQVPYQIQSKYKAVLIEKAVPEKNHHLYLKWLRYYLDFCLKYKFNQSNEESHPEFLNKLREKNQTSQQQNQALNALLFFFRHIKKESGEVKDIPRAKRKPYIPVVLSREEIDKIIIALNIPMI